MDSLIPEPPQSVYGGSKWNAYRRTKTKFYDFGLTDEQITQMVEREQMQGKEVIAQ